MNDFAHLPKEVQDLVQIALRSEKTASLRAAISGIEDETALLHIIEACKNKDKAAHNAAKRKLEELRQQAEHAAQQVRDAEALCAVMEQCSTDIDAQERAHLLLLAQQYQQHQAVMSPSQQERAQAALAVIERALEEDPVRLHAAAHAEVVTACEKLVHLDAISIEEVFAIDPLLQKEARLRSGLKFRPELAPTMAVVSVRQALSAARKLRQQLGNLEQQEDAGALEELLEGIDWPAELAVPEDLNKAHARLDRLRHQDRKAREEERTARNTARALLQSAGAALENGDFRAARSHLKEIGEHTEILRPYWVSSIHRARERISAEIRHLERWLNDVAQPQKLEICDELRSLIDQPLDARQAKSVYARMNAVTEARRRWSEIDAGLLSTDQKLWKTFNELCEAAKAPCKPFYEKREQLQQQNAGQMQNIVKDLKNGLKRPPEELSRLLHGVGQRLDRIKLLPGSKKEREGLRKGVQQAVSEAEAALVPHYETWRNRKRRLIERTQLLAQRKIDKPKDRIAQLMEQWKKIPQLPHEENEALWNEFRTACDTVFEADRSARGLMTTAELQKKSQELLDELEQIGRLDDAAMLNQGNRMADLEQQFEELKRPPREIAQAFRKRLKELNGRLRNLNRSQKRAHLDNVRKYADACAQVESAAMSYGKEAAELAPPEMPDVPKPWRELVETRSQTCSKLLAAPSDCNFVKLLSEHRRLVIELEIAAEVSTPKKDADMRMKIKMELMQKSLQTQQSQPRKTATWLKRWCGLPAGVPNEEGEKQMTQLIKRFDTALKGLG
ncbi:MAG: DUF349 domain-containing protein [Gammaproteobacteria bacterium AqS3]|nr:DUF349 domain-containing protein [Gammaproteobacteria bacterium AqS3]